MDIVTNHFNFNTTLNQKCNFALQLIPLVPTSNLFSLEVVQNANTANFVYNGIDIIDSRVRRGSSDGDHRPKCAQKNWSQPVKRRSPYYLQRYVQFQQPAPFTA